jgi:hypothetical protein
MSRTALALCAALLAIPASISATEGIWMPEQVPLLAEELRQRGLEIAPAALADLTGHPLGAIVSLGGCSASFVSPDGLIVTNHHCVTGALQYNSTPERDLLAGGFLAALRELELGAGPGSRVWVTRGVEDVTAAVLDGLDGLGDLERQIEIEARRKRLVAECEAPADVRCVVASFFEGSLYRRITQQELRDVRLVYAPAAGVGNFGGEIDNWMWPRHTGDFAFLRAYAGPDGQSAEPAPENVPFRPQHWLRMSTSELSADDFVVVLGTPGVTYRYQTAEEVHDDLDFGLPESNRYRRALMTLLEEAGAADPEVALRNSTRWNSLANFHKKVAGTLEAFERAGLLERRREEERAIAERLAGDPEAAAAHRRVMDEIAAQLARRRQTRERDLVLAWLSTASPLLAQAVLLHRLSIERERPDGEREPGYQERDWPTLEGRLRRAQSIIEPSTDRAGLRWVLQRALELPAGQRLEAIDQALAERPGDTSEARLEALLDRLYSGTRLADLEERLALFSESAEGLAGRSDPLLDLAAALHPLREQLEGRDREIAGAMSRLRPRYVAAVQEQRGGLLAPDANRTLRVSFGEVRGYAPRDGVRYAPQTTIAGILEKERGEDPFASPARLLERARAGGFDAYADPDLGTLPVNFLSTADSTNGSSGSATLNARGELVGLLFDGNYESMASDYLVEPEITRSIHVDARYMLWVMDAVDGAHHLLREMGLSPRFEDGGRP